MTGCGIDRGGPKDSENAHNSFLAKINEKGFWRFAVDIALFLQKNARIVKSHYVTQQKAVINSEPFVFQMVFGLDEMPFSPVWKALPAALASSQSWSNSAFL